MSQTLVADRLTAEAFRAFGDVLDVRGAPDKVINQGRCYRFHDLAALDFGTDGRAGISLFQSELCTYPVELPMMERHPEGSQAFLPMDTAPFLVVVAPDRGGQPGTPLAFETAPGQAVNYHRGTWHGVLMPLGGHGQFAVVDRIGNSANLEEHWFETPWTILPPPAIGPA